MTQDQLRQVARSKISKQTQKHFINKSPGLMHVLVVAHMHHVKDVYTEIEKYA